MNSGPERLAMALGEIEARLDWPALGRLYCDEGGEDFFDDQAREAFIDTGLRLASDVAEALQGLSGSQGRSLYVGAAVAELPLLLCESLVLGRKVVCAGPASPERTALDLALAQAEEELGFRLPRYGQESVPRRPRASFGVFDHLWMVSVLTDPEGFPALHDWLYERGGTELATGRGDRVRERARAEELIERLLECVESPALFTTTDEELVLVREVTQRQGWRLDEPKLARLSGIVGDPVRVCRLGR